MDVVKTERKIARRSASLEEWTAKSSTITTTNNNNNNNHHLNNSKNTVKMALDESEGMDTKDSSSETSGRGNGESSSVTSSRVGPFARFRRRGAALPLPGRSRRAYSAPAGVGRRHRRRWLVEDHYRVDSERRVVLPGVPKQDDNWDRDLHDFFNLVVLIPVVALNVMNWNWDLLINMMADQILPQVQPRNGNKNLYNALSLPDAWTGEWFDLFFQVTSLYFIVDLVWVICVPGCVRSPATIIQHHIATILYILIPYYQADFQWCMGACMIVEVNTWFLIARRVFNKQGFPPWVLNLSFVSIRVKLISVFFYITWISIRCILYPYLMPKFYLKWINHSKKVGTPWNFVALCVPLHAIFCLLNLKWTYELLMSKIRFWTRPKNNKYVAAVDKGL